MNSWLFGTGREWSQSIRIRLRSVGCSIPRHPSCGLRLLWLTRRGFDDGKVEYVSGWERCMKQEQGQLAGSRDVVWTFRMCGRENELRCYYKWNFQRGNHVYVNSTFSSFSWLSSFRSSMSDMSEPLSMSSSWSWSDLSSDGWSNWVNWGSICVT